MDIRLVALDLDGTTMNSDNRLSDYNRKSLEAAVQAGIQVVVASGRAFDALPKEVLAIPGLQYAISSNGAHITDLTTGKFPSMRSIGIFCFGLAHAKNAPIQFHHPTNHIVVRQYMR